MSRSICSVCERPAKVCLCQWIEPITNEVDLGILQHPSEVSQIKGSAKIVQLAFQKCQTWIGEEIDQLEEFKSWLNEGKAVFLLYPGIENQIEPFKSFDIPQIRRDFLSKDIKLLILDGTWRKTHKMMMLSSTLRGLNRISLIPTSSSNYLIRKQKNAESLSTVEAVYETYAQLEHNEGKYQPLLSAFESMQNQQLAFRKSPTTE